MTSETGNKVHGRLHLIKNEATYMGDKGKNLINREMLMVP